MSLRATQLEAPAPVGLGLSGPLRFGVLGDSIAAGQGADRPADAVGPRLTVALTAAGMKTSLGTFAVPRARSDGLAEQVTRASTWRVQLALIIIGANDLTHFVPTQQAAHELGAAVRTLRAGGARVVVTPAPDLSVVPWVPLQFRALVSNGSALLRQAQVEAAHREGAVIADVGDTAARFAVDPTLFADDRFHPSSAGYAAIAGALAPTVLAEAERIHRTTRAG